MHRGIGLFAITGSFFIAFMLGIQTWNLALTMWDPFYYYGATVITPVVHRGGVFEEELDVQRNRVCKVDIDRFLVNEETNNVFMRIREPAGATQIGRGKTTNRIKIPADAPLGRVKVIQNTSSQCIDGVHTIPWPTVWFEIVE